MAHMVETMVSGQGITPWHRLGKVVPGLLTAEEVIREAEIGWEVKKFPVYTFVDGKKIHVKDQFATIRMSDLRPLGIVGDRYEVIQNIEALDWMDYIVGEGAAQYTTAGSLRGGKNVWIAAEIPSRDPSNLDSPVHYFVSRTSHDGTTSCEVYFTSIRPVCWNTLSAGVRGRKQCMKIRHTTSAKEKMEIAKEAISHAHKYFESLDGIFARMHDKVFRPEQLAELIEKTFGFKEEGSTRAQNRKEKVMGEIINLSLNGKGTELPGVKGTVWGAYNAIAEYTDHNLRLNKVNGNEASRRFDSNLWGRSADIKQVAFDAILEMAQIAA